MGGVPVSDSAVPLEMLRENPMSHVKFPTFAGVLVARVIPILLIALFVTCLPVLAQTGRGSVRGVVRDQNQGVIPGVDVTLTNLQTNVKRTAVTSDVGIYYFGGVATGDYSLLVEMPGFSPWKTQFNLEVGATASIDATLEVGQVATVVEVSGTTAQEVTVDRVEVADVKDFARIQQLPLNGRSVTNLFDLTPGVEGGDAA